MRRFAATPVRCSSTLASAALAARPPAANQNRRTTSSDPCTGAEQGHIRYSTAVDMTCANVDKLEAVWHWEPNEMLLEQYGIRSDWFRAGPIMMGKYPLPLHHAHPHSGTACGGGCRTVDLRLGAKRRSLGQAFLSLAAAPYDPRTFCQALVALQLLSRHYPGFHILRESSPPRKSSFTSIPGSPAPVTHPQRRQPSRRQPRCRPWGGHWDEPWAAASRVRSRCTT